MTFTTEEQQRHRDAFIKDCKQKAWGASCHADFIAKQLDGVIAHYEKLQAEDRALKQQIEELEHAPDFHKVENREKRKALDTRRSTINSLELPGIASNVKQAQNAIGELHRNIESNLALAKHAEGWEWKELG